MKKIQIDRYARFLLRSCEGGGREEEGRRGKRERGGGGVCAVQMRPRSICDRVAEEYYEPDGCYCENRCF